MMDANLKNEVNRQCGEVKLRCLSIVLFITLLAPSLASSDHERWWQKEIPTPGKNQMVNPEYLDGKRSLDLLWDLRNRALEALKVANSRGEKATAIVRALADLDKQINHAESDLYEVPVIILVPSYREEVNHGTQLHAGGQKGLQPDKITDSPRPGTLIRFAADTSRWDWSMGGENLFTGQSTPPRPLNPVEKEDILNTDVRYKGTGGLSYFATIIYPAEEIGRLLRGEGIISLDGGSIELEKVAFSDFYYFPADALAVPPSGGLSESKKAAALEVMSEKLRAGKAVLLPLGCFGEDVNLNMPEGLYFLQHVVVLKMPNRFHSGKLQAGPTENLCALEVSRDKPQVVSFQPNIFCTGSDVDREHGKYLQRLKNEGALAIITSYDKRKRPTQTVPEKKSIQVPERDGPIIIVKVRCLNCDKLNDEDANYCRECGKPLRKEIKYE